MKGKPKGRTLTTAPSSPADAKPYEPTSHEKAAVQRLLDQRKNRAPAPKYKVTVGNGRTSIEPDHPEPAAAFSLLTNVFSTSDAHFAEGLLYQLANVSRTGKDVTARELNTMIATVHAIGPRDPTETLLAAQMAAIHQATMVAARRLNHTETIDQQDSCSGMLNKLARTFATQVEALKRYRSCGEQNVKVTHQHVSVTAGQAVVGINQGEGEPMKSRANPMHLERLQAQAHLMHTAPRCSAMSKRSRCRCRAPAVKGRAVCRMHGARAGAPKGNANGAWRHGMATNDMVAERQELAVLVREAGKMIAALQGSRAR